MTELADQPATGDTALTTILAQIDAWTLRMIEVRPANKATVCEALVAAGIDTVVITFDGAGDSGQVEHIRARIGETEIDLPDVRVALLDPKQDGSGIEQCEVVLREAIEALVYDCLAETHGGWENDEGAYGEFTLDVGAQTIVLEYNERYLETHFSQHQF